MEQRRPKRTPGPADEDRQGPDGGPSGCGEYDAATGLYEYYEDTVEAGTPLTWEELLTHFPAIVADFAEHYRIRLHQRPAMSWAEFRDLLFGLLRTESRLRALTAPPPPEPEAGGLFA